MGESEIDQVIPFFNTALINKIDYYIVENIRTARRFLSKSKIETKIDDLVFYELNKHTQPEELAEFIKPLLNGKDIGLISEAGCPAVADPGADIVALSHNSDIEVVPLVGPSSILLALMASGFNGQSFAFNGYLPVKSPARVAKLKKDEQRSRTEGQTQIYIEAPYRNRQLLDAMIATLNPTTKLCVAIDLTLDSQQITTKTVKAWKQNKPEFHKRPAIFLFQA
jgi:16S rRNA (cytidine1402-2'-O)-methyltransferase